MKVKLWALPLLVLSVLFTSCFNNLKTPKETSVSFYMDEATVQKILQASAKPRSAVSSRAATDEQNETAGYFIDVTLIGEAEQTKTALLTKDVQLEFTNVLVNSSVYAKAQVYKYLNSKKTEKEIIYRGESKKITVRDNGNVLSIKLTTATLTVTFDSNGGSEVPSQLVQTGSAATEPEKPVKPEGKKKYSRENYAFAGWFTDPELTKEYNFELPVKDDFTLYAKWLPDFVFVEGATVNDYLVTGRNIKISDLYVSDHEVTQAEYKAVIGSNPSSNRIADNPDNLPVENVTWLEAIKYCNKLSENEGLDPCYKIDGNEVTCTLSANGYRLPTEAEWEYIAVKAKRDTALSNIAWINDNKTHQVKFSLADELCLCDIYGNVAEWCFDVYSETVTKSTGPTGPMAVTGTSANRVVRGGSFQSSAADCTPQTRASADPAEKSVAIGFRVVRTVVYEFKIEKNTVTFEPNGGSTVDLQIVVQGDCATEPAAPTRTGYIFKGWQYAGEAFDFSTSITQDILLEAKWEVETYTISYDLGGGTIATANPTTYTIETETFTLNNPVKDSYNFKGWYNGTQKVTKIEKGSYGNLNLVASWTQCHLVYFDKQDGSTVEQQEVENNQTAAAPADPTRTGFAFVRWYETDEDTPFDFTTPITGNVTLKALWQYEVTYVSNGGSEVTSQTYKHTQTVSAPADPTRTGFTFDAWCELSADGPQYTFGSASTTGNITLYARWKYTITYDTGNGESPTTVENIHTAPVTEPAEPSWSTMTFVCWCSDPELQIEYTFGSPSENGNITLYAKWEYLITFDTQGAGTIPQQWVIYPNAPVEPDPAPSKDHFDFEYWCTDLSDPENTKYLFNTPYISNDRTLHAKFKAIEQNLGGITVTFGIATGDIDVTVEQSGNTLTCTVKTNDDNYPYNSYYWEFDGQAQTTTSSEFSKDLTGLLNGRYDIYLEAVKDGVTYSWSQQITISN